MDVENLKIEHKKHSGEIWELTTMDFFLAVVEDTRDCIQATNNTNHDANDYTKERAIWNLATGRTIDTPFLQFRLAEGEICHYCNAKFIKHMGALSRRDNKTYICADCGTREAIEDFKGQSKIKEVQ